MASQNREDGCSLSLFPKLFSLSSQFSRTLLSSAGRGREPRIPVGIWNGAQLKEQFENIFSPFSPYNSRDGIQEQSMIPSSLANFFATTLRQRKA